jgi:hypothetical protein
MTGYTEFTSVVCIAEKSVCALHTGAEESVLTGSFPGTLLTVHSIRLFQSFLRLRNLTSFS